MSPTPPRAHTPFPFPSPSLLLPPIQSPLPCCPMGSPLLPSQWHPYLGLLILISGGALRSGQWEACGWTQHVALVAIYTGAGTGASRCTPDVTVGKILRVWRIRGRPCGSGVFGSPPDGRGLRQRTAQTFSPADARMNGAICFPWISALCLLLRRGRSVPRRNWRSKGACLLRGKVSG